MTPTNHSNGTIATEGVASSSKTAAESQDDTQLFISDMLSKLEEDFQKSGNSIMDRMKEMGSKMDGLEQNIHGLVQDAGLDEEEDQNSEDFHGSNASSGADSSELPQTPSSQSHMTV
jgi:hypothetical protein